MSALTLAHEASFDLPGHLSTIFCEDFVCNPEFACKDLRPEDLLVVALLVTSVYIRSESTIRPGRILGPLRSGCYETVTIQIKQNIFDLCALVRHW